MDPLYTCLFLYKTDRLTESLEECNEILESDPSCKAAFLLKAQILTEISEIDELELDLETIVDQELGNDEAFTKTKPKTGNNRNNLTTAMAGGQAPGTRAGYLRPETQSRMMTSSGNRTAKTARPVTGMTGRAQRMKTAAAAQEDNPLEFIDTTRLDPVRYGSDFHYGPIMFECEKGCKYCLGMLVWDW